jgi:peptidoglycan glycosyltransferase
MRANIARLGTLLVAAFLVIALALTYWQVIAAPGLETESGNGRMLDAEHAGHRGAILDRNGAPLAATNADGTRTYAAGAAPITGYHSDRFGNSGLEAAQDAALRGASGGSLAERFEQQYLHQPVVGADVVTTIDLKIQQAAVDAHGDKPGAIVALDPRSGAVLALASNPTFDPTALDQQFDTLRGDTSGPLLNRATESAYVSGSVFKLVTASAALDKGLVDLSQPFACTTEINLGGQVVNCRNNVIQGVNQPTYKQAFAWSSNRTFALTGLLLGFPPPLNQWLSDTPPGPYPWDHASSVQPSARVLEEYAGRYGFGQQIPFDLPVRPSQLKNADSEWSVGLLASTAFGQGEISVTPLQMALVIATMGNDGKVPRPYLVSALRSATGDETVVNPGGGWSGQAVSAQTAHTLLDFLVEGVDHGYAAKAAIPGVKVGGKTGTAQVSAGEMDHSWFIGIAPADNPRVAVAVVFEHGGPGSDVATPAGGQVIQTALQVYKPAGRG